MSCRYCQAVPRISRACTRDKLNCKDHDQGVARVPVAASFCDTYGCCPECGAPEGKLHHAFGQFVMCLLEACPVCQLIGCTKHVHKWEA